MALLLVVGAILGLGAVAAGVRRMASKGSKGGPLRLEIGEPPTATEVRVMAVGTLSVRGQQLELSIPGVGTPLTLSGGRQAEALEKRPDLAGKRVRVTGKLQLAGDKPPTAMSVEEFQSPVSTTGGFQLDPILSYRF